MLFMSDNNDVFNTGLAAACESDNSWSGQKNVTITAA